MSCYKAVLNGNSSHSENITWCRTEVRLIIAPKPYTVGEWTVSRVEYLFLGLYHLYSLCVR